jgi:hypothetical protein
LKFVLVAHVMATTADSPWANCQCQREYYHRQVDKLHTQTSCSLPGRLLLLDAYDGGHVALTSKAAVDPWDQ